jgi:hypothetical protein
LVYFVTIWYILWVIWYTFSNFGMFYQDKSGNPDLKLAKLKFLVTGEIGRGGPTIGATLGIVLVQGYAGLGTERVCKPNLPRPLLAKMRRQNSSHTQGCQIFLGAIYQNHEK